MGKPYSLCISVQKLRQLKEGKCDIVSHKCSTRWENFYKKNLPRIRFFDQKFFESAIFSVKSTEKIAHVEEHIIRINIGKRIL